LTPMTDASLVRLMAAQSEKDVGLVRLRDVRAGPDAVAGCIEDLKAAGITYGVVDAITDDDLGVIGKAAASHVLVTGGSGVALGLPANLREAGLLGAASVPAYPSATGRALVLAGSCSQATRAQIAHVADKWPCRTLDVDRIAAGEDVAGGLTSWATAQAGDKPVLIYSSAEPEAVAKVQARYGAGKAGQMIENTMGKIARSLLDLGFNRLVVAGGETSGAVVSALGVSVLRIGPEIAPGVPWTEARGSLSLALALKSGNFGGPDFFEDAFAVLP
ncbi:MAG: four-carbon acid sugar kinase family protein, partial [Alphaproteobacteria bacterium]